VISDPHLKSNQPQTKANSFLNKLPPSITRVLTAVVLLPVLIASLLVDQLAIVFCLLAAAAIVLGEIEFWLLARKQQIRADPVAGLLVKLMEADLLSLTGRGKKRDRARDEGQLEVAFPIGARGHELLRTLNAAAVNQCGAPTFRILE